MEKRNCEEHGKYEFVNQMLQMVRKRTMMEYHNDGL